MHRWTGYRLSLLAEHDINAYVQLLRRDGNITIVGLPDKPHAVSALTLLFKRRLWLADRGY
jgi:D-arabinose 1-dehydrogenase-like Zn-dependent alcohol dehydrogenase